MRLAEQVRALRIRFVASTRLGEILAGCQAIKLYDDLDANSARIVECGLVGVRGARWPGRFRSESPLARKDRCHHRLQQRDWNAEAQLSFLTDAYNKVRDLFGLSGASIDDIRALIGR